MVGVNGRGSEDLKFATLCSKSFILSSIPWNFLRDRDDVILVNAEEGDVEGGEDAVTGETSAADVDRNRVFRKENDVASNSKSSFLVEFLPDSSKICL